MEPNLPIRVGVRLAGWDKTHDRGAEHSMAPLGGNIGLFCVAKSGPPFGPKSDMGRIRDPDVLEQRRPDSARVSQPHDRIHMLFCCRTQSHRGF